MAGKCFQAADRGQVAKFVWGEELASGFMSASTTARAGFVVDMALVLHEQARNKDRHSGQMKHVPFIYRFKMKIQVKHKIQMEKHNIKNSLQVRLVRLFTDQRPRVVSVEAHSHPVV